MAKPKTPRKTSSEAAKPANGAESTFSEVRASETVSPAVAATAPAAEAADVANARTKRVLSKPESTAMPVSGKPSIVKSEPRANLVPINIEDEIRQLAYLFSERRGFTPGHETEDWLAAEHEVRERYHQPSAQHTA
jgi:hypothetical protein